eukprot:GHVP01037635.1.p1 GENE.GHVP01037635.1~~GHVP01037635.1.p1  ORF type:complete len:321 (-),score=64.88 GHVP01037635.1:2628-3590(-)
MGRKKGVEYTPCRVDEINLYFEIGRGTFGNVYLGEIRGFEYAVKVMKKKQMIEAKQLQHLKSEREISMRAESTFMVKTYQALQDSTYLYFVMEFIPGGEVFSLMDKIGVLPEFAGCFYIAQMVLFFSDLHYERTIYRDLKLENILIDADGYIKISDFGFAKKVFNATYTVCGTPEYFAPEVLRGEGYGKSVDWYTLGIVMFELLTGNPPFLSENRDELYSQIFHLVPVIPENISPLAKDLILKLLVKTPEDRLGSGRDGAEEVKNHPWFESMDWESLRNKKIKPPFIPSKNRQNSALRKTFLRISEESEAEYDFPGFDKL